MKDFRLDRKTEQDYIKNVKPVKGKTEGEKEAPVTLTITFADGRKFKGVKYDEENLGKIIEQQEKQAKAGVANLGVFEKRRTRAGVMTAASVIGGPVIGAIASTLIANPVTLAIGAGALTLAALVPSVCSLARNAGKVGELKKIQYRDEHRAQLSRYPEYQNALAGLSDRKRAWFETMAKEKEDPFCITEMGSYRMSDIEKIMANMGTQDNYGFTYAKKPTASKK